MPKTDFIISILSFLLPKQMIFFCPLYLWVYPFTPIPNIKHKANHCLSLIWAFTYLSEIPIVSAPCPQSPPLSCVLVVAVPSHPSVEEAFPCCVPPHLFWICLSEYFCCLLVDYIPQVSLVRMVKESPSPGLSISRSHPLSHTPALCLLFPTT